MWVGGVGGGKRLQTGGKGVTPALAGGDTMCGALTTNAWHCGQQQLLDGCEQRVWAWHCMAMQHAMI